jgi:hypothetical protein
MRLTDEEALLLAFRVRLDECSAIAVPRESTRTGKEKR